MTVNNDVNAGTAGVSLTAGDTTASAREITNNANITGGNATNKVVLTADNMNLTGNSTIHAGNVAILQPKNNNVTIELGGSTSAGVLDLITAALDTVTAGILPSATPMRVTSPSPAPSPDCSPAPCR